MKLTAPERLWLAELQEVLDRCPSERIGFYTIGDPDVSLYDRRKDGEISNKWGDLDFPQAAERAGATLSETIKFPSNVHSVAG